MIKKKKKQLKAMKELLKCYEGKERLNNCPLCKAVGQDEYDDISKCNSCVWVYFTGATCSGYKMAFSRVLKCHSFVISFRKPYDYSKPVTSLQNVWSYIRIVQLKHWIKEVKKMIKEDEYCVKSSIGYTFCKRKDKRIKK